MVTTRQETGGWKLQDVKAERVITPALVSTLAEAAKQSMTELLASNQREAELSSLIKLVWGEEDAFEWLGETEVLSADDEHLIFKILNYMPGYHFVSNQNGIALRNSRDGRIQKNEVYYIVARPQEIK